MRFELGKLELFGLDLGSLWQRWWQGLNSLSPVPLADIFLRPAARVRVRMDDSGLQVACGRNGRLDELLRLSHAELELLDDGKLQDQLLAVAGKESLQLDVQLPENRVLRRRLSVPLAARGNLRQMLAFQISKLTPFTREQVLYDVVECSGDAGTGLLEVELVVVPAGFAQHWMTQIGRVTGLQVARLQVAPAADQPRTANLLGRLGVPSGWHRRLNLNAWLAALLVASMGLVLMAPVLKLRLEVMQSKREVAALEARLQETRSHWHELQNSSESLAYLLEQQAKHGRPLMILDTLTRLLPDGIYLSGMTLDKDRIQISGEGREVVELVELLNASPLFEQARFASAVTRGRNNVEVFSITMQLAGPQLDAGLQPGEAQ